MWAPIVLLSCCTSMAMGVPPEEKPKAQAGFWTRCESTTSQAVCANRIFMPTNSPKMATLGESEREATMLLHTRTRHSWHSGHLQYYCTQPMVAFPFLFFVSSGLSFPRAARHLMANEKFTCAQKECSQWCIFISAMLQNPVQTVFHGRHWHLACSFLCRKGSRFYNTVALSADPTT